MFILPDAKMLAVFNYKSEQVVLLSTEQMVDEGVLDAIMESVQTSNAQKVDPT